jgi:ABC-type cobalt transport system substrate-binding protein
LGQDEISVFCGTTQPMPLTEAKFRLADGLNNPSSRAKINIGENYMMKAKLMALALLFAFIGFINSQAGTVANGRAVVEGIKGGSLQSWLVSSWHPSPEVQGLLFLLQAAVGCAMVVYFLRSQKKSKDLDWTQFD